MQSEKIKELQTRLEHSKLENQQLKFENDRLNDLLIEINNKLENSELFKTHFISNVTNELINPFTSIIGLAQSILSADKQDWKRIITMVALIHTETFNLELQLKNILNAARIEAGLMYLLPTKTDVKALLDDIKSNFKHELRKHMIRLETRYIVDDDRPDKNFFITDAEKLNILLSNLLTNAIKFSATNQSIQFSTQIKKDQMVFSISDHGIGISEQDRAKIFNRFTRLENEINSVRPGQGLGLSICKGLAELFGGEIKVSGKEGVGTTFLVIIPEHEQLFDAFATNDNETFFDADELF